MLDVSALRKPALLVAMAIFTLVIVTFFVAYGSARRTARSVKILLADMQSIHLGSNLADAQRFIDAHALGGSTKERTCTGQRDGTDCELVIRLNNHWLAKLYLVPPTEVVAAFTSSRGSVVRMEAAVIVRRLIPGTFQNVYAASVIEQVFDPELGREPFYRIHKLANTNGKITPLLVDYRLDERATPDQRKLAYSSLNLSCLYRLGGCKDGEMLAPSAWTAADKIWHGDETVTQESR